MNPSRLFCLVYDAGKAYQNHHRRTNSLDFAGPRPSLHTGRTALPQINEISPHRNALAAEWLFTCYFRHRRLEFSASRIGLLRVLNVDSTDLGGSAEHHGQISS